MVLNAHPTIIEDLGASLPTAALAANLNLVEMEQSVELLAKQLERMQQEASRCASCAGDKGPAVRTLRLLSSLVGVSDSKAAFTEYHECATPDDSQSSAHVIESGFGDETSFGVQLEAFADSALPALDNLRAELRATTENYRELMQYLGEVPVDGISSEQSTRRASKLPNAPPPPPPPPPPPAGRTGSLHKTPFTRRRTSPPPTPAQLFGTIDSFSTGLCAAASDLIRKNAIEATKERAENARRERLRQLQRQSPKRDDIGACDVRTSLLEQIRMRRHE